MKFKNLTLSLSTALLLQTIPAAHASLPLPDEMLAEVFSFLTPSDAVGAATVNTQFCSAAHDRLEQHKYELIAKFCDTTNIYGYQQGVQGSARKLLALTQPPHGTDQEIFDIARLNALNLIYGVTLNQVTKKLYAAQFKEIYRNASTGVKQRFEAAAKNFK